jgi:CHASE1-domain containing sensor protein
VDSGSGERGRRSGPETGRFSANWVRSAFSSWRASIRGADILVASVLAALSLGLGAYVLARAQAAVHLAFTEHAQRLEAAVAERVLLPQEDLTVLSRFLETSGQTTRWQFRRLTFSMLERHRLVYALRSRIPTQYEVDASEDEA